MVLALVCPVSAQAGTLVPDASHAGSVLASIHGCGGHGAGSTDPTQQSCSSDFAAVPNCSFEPSTPQPCVLAQDGAFTRQWYAGVDESGTPLSWIRRIDAAPGEPLLDARVWGTHGNDTIEIGADFARLPVEALVLGDRPVMQAWWNGQPGIAVLDVTDSIELRTPFVVQDAGDVHLRWRMTATDVRTNDRSFHAVLRWTIRTADGLDIASGRGELTSPDQEMSLELPRNPPVDCAKPGRDTIRLGRDAYELVTSFMRDTPGNSILTRLDACGMVQGAASDTESVTLRISSQAPSDLDGNGHVDFGDAAIVLLDFGPCSGACPSDLDDSGEVDFGDFALLLLDYSG
jgi:hypothetical protein